jgi:hypothetical protein
MTPKVLWEIVKRCCRQIVWSQPLKACAINSCSGTCRSKPRSVTSDASRSSGLPSTTGSELDRSLGRKASEGRVQRPPVIDPNLQTAAAGGRMMVDDGQG